MPAFNEIEIEPLTGAAGCEIKGVDLTKPLPEGVLEEIMRAFEHFLGRVEQLFGRRHVEQAD